MPILFRKKITFFQSSCGFNSNDVVAQTYIFVFNFRFSYFDFDSDLLICLQIDSHPSVAGLNYQFRSICHNFADDQNYLISIFLAFSVQISSKHFLFLRFKECFFKANIVSSLTLCQSIFIFVFKKKSFGIKKRLR